MKRLKVTNFMNGKVLVETNDEHTMAIGDCIVKFRPEPTPTLPPSPPLVSDLAWISEEEERAWYEERHGTLNGEADDFDEFDDEPMEDEAS